MKICIVSCEYPPFRGGGIGTYARNISRFLALAGNEVHVVANAWADFAPEGNPPPQIETDGNLTIHRIDGITSKYSPRPQYDGRNDRVGQICKEWESSLFWSTLVADKLAEIIPKYGIQVVEFPETYAEAFIATRRKLMGEKALDIPYVITLHTPMEEVAEYNFIRKFDPWLQRRIMMENYAILRAERLSCPSRTLAQMVCQRLQLDPETHPCDVIHNPMDFDSLEHIPPPDPGHEENKTLLFVGRIEPRKGVKEMVDAACIVMREDPEVTVHLIGKDCPAGEVPGSMTEFMKQRIPEELKPRFFFEGLRPREEVLRRYGSATLCVFASSWDNFPYTCCEAMAYGACVIGSSFGGTAEMIEDGRSGLIFPADDVGALAAQIKRALADPDLRAQLRKNAGPRIRDICSPDRAVQIRIEHYSKAIERHRRRKRIVVPANPLRSKKLAVYVPNAESEAAIRTTVESVQRSAKSAGVELDLTIVGSVNSQILKKPLPGTRLDYCPSEGFDAGLWHWFQHVKQIAPDYIFRIRPGESVSQDYFSRVGEALEIEPGVAWATTWLQSVDDRPQKPFVGFDFSLPLEMICYHAIPYAVVRYVAYTEVGGLNFDLPTGWREWDLWLALDANGWKGKIVPHWAGKYIPWWGIELSPIEHPKAQELVLERIIRRNPRPFREHGAWLWVSLISNQSARRAEQKQQAGQHNPSPHPSPDATPHHEPLPQKPNGIIRRAARKIKRLLN